MTGMDIYFPSVPDPICEPCLAGNMKRIVNKTASHNKELSALVHSDLHGPMPVASRERATSTSVSLWRTRLGSGLSTS